MIIATKPTKKHETLFFVLCDLVVFVVDNTSSMKLLKIRCRFKKYLTAVIIEFFFSAFSRRGVGPPMGRRLRSPR